MNTKQLIILAVIVGVTLVGATATATYIFVNKAYPAPAHLIMEEMEGMPIQGMPCHQMPGGSWMGDCTEEDKQLIMEMNDKPAKPTYVLPFTQSIYSLEQTVPSLRVELDDGEVYSLSADFVKKSLGGNTVRMMGYNKQVPGPFIVVKQGSSVIIDFTNNLDMETTVHWHGLRLDNRFDGVPGVTQDVVLPGESFSYELVFPDPGVYWYHPHVREDYQQELGLYGNILVLPEEEDYFSEVDHDELIILDDVLLRDGTIVDFFPDRITHAIMGRFGNTMLTNGETHFEASYPANSVVRMYFTNVANARPFNVSIPGAQMKLVGGDVSGYEEEAFVDSIILAPAERYIADVYFEDPGTYELTHINPHKSYSLGTITVVESSDYSEKTFSTLKNNDYVMDEMRSYEEYFSSPPDETYELDIVMPGMMGRMMMSDAHGIEWEDDMPMMAMMTNNTLEWVIKETSSGNINHEIMPAYEVGDLVKIRLINKDDSMHPMQHPIHFHGQRFVIVSRDGVMEENLVWKDTTLVEIGETVDLLLEITNPGDWMVHCHIAEHLQSGMMYSFSVE